MGLITNWRKLDPSALIIKHDIEKKKSTANNWLFVCYVNVLFTSSKLVQ